MSERDTGAPSHSLDEILAELHEALEASDGTLDPALCSELRAAASEIEAALGDGPATLSGSLRERLRVAVEQFEESHPRLTSIVGRIADALSDLGI
jgi:hypothetical protein